MRFEPSRAMTSMPRLATWLIVLASMSVVIVADAVAGEPQARAGRRVRVRHGVAGHAADHRRRRRAREVDVDRRRAAARAGRDVEAVDREVADAVGERPRRVVGDAHADVVVVERALRRAAVVDLDVHRAGPVRDDLQAVGAVAQERVAEDVGGDRAAVGLQQEAVVAGRDRVGVAERRVGDVELRQRARRVHDPRVVLRRVRDERARELRVAGEVREVQAGLVGGGVVAVVVDDASRAARSS